MQGKPGGKADMRRKEIPEALLPQVVEDVEAGQTPYETLAARCGMCRATFVRRIREIGAVPKHVDRLGRRFIPRKPKPALPPSPHMMVSAALQPVASDREPAETAALALRLRREIDHQLESIERMRDSTDAAGYQRLLVVSRMLTGLSRTLQAAMRAEQTQPLPQKEYDFVRDYDELRRDLHSRLDALIAEQQNEISG
jgi:hypothetical protein